jgi:hypothetical protein
MVKSFSMLRKILFAALAGLVITILLTLASYVADTLGARTASKLLFWPNTLLQTLVPLHTIGKLEKPIYEGTPLNFLAFIASFPFAILFYGIGAFFILGYGKQRS